MALCIEKRAFPHRMAAEHALQVQQALTSYRGYRNKPPCAVYQCPYCTGWHLTHMDQPVRAAHIASTATKEGNA